MHHYKRNVLTIAVSAVAVVAAACGDSDGDTSAADGPTKTVQVEMVDIGFKPETIEVAKGESVRFVFANSGKARHEAYIGTTTEQAVHADEMRDGGADSGGHDGHGGDESDGTKITLEPGDSGELETAFGEAGTYEIGCHEPGHYAAGMKITVNVT